MNQLQTSVEEIEYLKQLNKELVIACDQGIIAVKSVLEDRGLGKETEAYYLKDVIRFIKKAVKKSERGYK